MKRLNHYRPLGLPSSSRGRQETSEGDLREHSQGRREGQICQGRLLRMLISRNAQLSGYPRKLKGFVLKFQKIGKRPGNNRHSPGCSSCCLMEMWPLNPHSSFPSVRFMVRRGWKLKPVTVVRGKASELSGRGSWGFV